MGCGDNLAPPAVAAADVSILYPLPTTRDLLIDPAEEGAYGTLFPEKWFPTVIGPVDIETAYSDLRLIAVRFDPCSARHGCNPELRAIYQPVLVGPDGALTVADGAIHVFYDVPRDELVAMLIQILALKKSYADVAYDRALGPQPILVAAGLDSDFARGLHTVLLDHLGESRIGRFTERNHQIPLRDRWDFYLFERTDGDPVRQDIATTSVDEQQLTGTPHADPAVAGGIGGVNPVLATPVTAVVDENRPAVVTDDIRTGFAQAIELQDPTKENSESIDCVSCHLAEGARHVGTTEYGLIASGVFESDRSLEYRRDLLAVTNLHMFAYVGRDVSIMQRVANESAVTAEAMEKLIWSAR